MKCEVCNTKTTEVRFSVYACPHCKTETLYIDGSPHEVGNPDCCDQGQCECGGQIHAQGGYGFYVEMCDLCLNMK